VVNRHHCYGGYDSIVRDTNKVYPSPCPSVGDDLASGVEEDGYSSGCRFHGAVDLFQSTCVTCLVLEASDQFKGSMAATSALESWSLGACERRLPHCHQQHQADSVKGAATAARRRLALAAVLVVRWSKDLNVIFTMFMMPL
jgi:hypothetical protein